MITSLILWFFFALAFTCSTDQECTQLDTFCEGPSHCDLSKNKCVRQDVRYDPCAEMRERARTFNAAQSDVLSIICVNEVKACVELYYCTKDADCDDHRYCNGVERCVEGKCEASLAASPPCEDCDEETHCGTFSTLQNEEGGTAPADATGIYVVVAVFAILGSIAVFLLLVLICRAASKSSFI